MRVREGRAAVPIGIIANRKIGGVASVSAQSITTGNGRSYTATPLRDSLFSLYCALFTVHPPLSTSSAVRANPAVRTLRVPFVILGASPARFTLCACTCQAYFFFFGYNVLNTQATEHRGASPPPNEGFVQHAARDT